MRTREEIGAYLNRLIKEQGNKTVDAFDGLMVELLLDIRDLLQRTDEIEIIRSKM